MTGTSSKERHQEAEPTLTLRAMPPLLLFDFDGVLADSLSVFHESLAAACRERGFPQLHDRAVFLGLFDGNMIEGLRRLGLPDAKIPTLLADLGRRLAAVMDRYPPFPGIAEAFNTLTASVPVCVVTSNLTRVVIAYLAQYGLHGVREVLGSDTEPSKQAKIRRVAAQWPGRRPTYVGDTLGDLTEAHAAGACAVAVGWGWHDEARLRRGHPDRLLKQPSELASLLTPDAPAAGATRPGKAGCHG